MNDSTHIRSTRGRPAKPPLSETAIVKAALAITKAEGLDAVTMRRIASELDTGAASLYVYVRNRDELLRAMFDRVIVTLPLVEPDATRWREQTYGLMLEYRAALEAHPGLAAAFSGEPPTTEIAMVFLDNLLGVLRAGGIAPQDAAWACDVLGLIATATANETDIRRAAGQKTEANFHETVARLGETFAGASPERYPHVVALASELVTGDGDARFRFAIDTFLDGLAARSARG